MRLRISTIFAFGAVLLVGAGCAGAGGAGPVTSPTGEEYPPGTPPEETQNSQRALLALTQGNYEDALEQAQQGIAADSANPIHYYMAGSAYANLGQAEDANEMFERAESIYPAYELDIEPAREEAWGNLFNAGVEAYNEGDMERAAELWEQANGIYQLRHEGFMNLAVLYTQREDYDRAVDAYQNALAALEREPITRELEEEEITEREEARAEMAASLGELLLFTERYDDAVDFFRERVAEDPDNIRLRSSLAAALSQTGQEAEAQEIYEELLTGGDLSPDDMFNVGVALFNSQQYEQAAQAFEQVTEAYPNSRDAWYNYANSLYALERYDELVRVAERVVELDPLGENSALILAQAYRQTGNNSGALEVLQQNEARPVHLQDLEIRSREGAAVVSGTVVGNQAEAGTPVRIRVTIFGADGGELGTETVTIDAPAADQTASFEATISTTADPAAFTYELVG